MTPGEFFYQVFESLHRQGPGCTGATNKVWSYLPSFPDGSQILDIGCGSGTETRDLAALSTCTITAVDNHQPFLDSIRTQSLKDGTDGRIRTVCASMNALPFKNRQFDLIWSEGAIFIMGFEKGLMAWKPFLKKGGYMIVSDAAWFEPNPPPELMQWWEKEGYVPATEEQLKERVTNAGLRLLATYRLPEAGWWEHYYVPMLARIKQLRETHWSDPVCAAILDSFKKRGWDIPEVQAILWVYILRHAEPVTWINRVNISGSRVSEQCAEQSPMGKFSRFVIHWKSGRIASQSSFPSPVRYYSNRGGISEKASRPTNPSFCSATSISVSVLGLIPSSFFMRSLNPYTGRVPKDMDD